MFVTEGKLKGQTVCLRFNAYVDDVFASFNSEPFYNAFMDALIEYLRAGSNSGKNAISQSDDKDTYLSMKIEVLPDGAIKLQQKRYTIDMLYKFHHEDCKPASTPFQSGINLTKEMGPRNNAEREEMEGKPYRSLIGSLLHLARCTRPDISTAVHICAQYQSNPGLAHWKAACYILRYLNGTRNRGLIYGREIDGLPYCPCIGLCDSDYASCLDDRRSRTGMIWLVWGGVVSWASTKQTSVALSSTEAEYMAACDAAKHGLWMTKLMGDLGYGDLHVQWGEKSEQERTGAKPLVILEDNQGAIEWSKGITDFKRAKHIDTRYHFLQEQVNWGNIKLGKIPTKENLADMMTKALGPSTFIYHRDRTVPTGEEQYSISSLRNVNASCGYACAYAVFDPND